MGANDTAESRFEHAVRYLQADTSIRPLLEPAALAFSVAANPGLTLMLAFQDVQPYQLAAQAADTIGRRLAWHNQQHSTPPFFAEIRFSLPGKAVLHWVVPHGES